jgi:hypothetical protein
VVSLGRLSSWLFHTASALDANRNGAVSYAEPHGRNSPEVLIFVARTLRDVAGPGAAICEKCVQLCCDDIFSPILSCHGQHRSSEGQGLDRFASGRTLSVMSAPLFDFNRKAIAAELSSAANGTYLVNLETAETDGPSSVETFAPVRSGHPAIEAIAKRLDLPYSQGMDIPVEVIVPAVENELKSHGCQLARDHHPAKSEVLARWTWPPLT